MAGGFRKESGKEMYCAILTIVETLKRRKNGIDRKSEKDIYGYTGYFLAGVKSVGSAGRLNCNKKYIIIKKFRRKII